MNMSIEAAADSIASIQNRQMDAEIVGGGDSSSQAIFNCIYFIYISSGMRHVAFTSVCSMFIEPS